MTRHHSVRETVPVLWLMLEVTIPNLINYCNSTTWVGNDKASDESYQLYHAYCTILIAHAGHNSTYQSDFNTIITDSPSSRNQPTKRNHLEVGY